MSRRITNAELLRIAEGLSEREISVVSRVADLRLLSHAQLARLMPAAPGTTPASAGRSVRRTLHRLTDLGVLARLDRRIGGVRAGSAGHVYYLGPVGQRLMAYWSGDGLIRGRTRPEPGAPFVRHRLATSELYVLAAEAQHRGELELLGFDVEPSCWRESVSPLGEVTTLKPDAFARVGIGAYEDRWFIEVDLGSESRTVLRRKLQLYLDYFQTGTEQADHGVFPRVLWLTDTEARKEVLVDLCAALPEEYWTLFAVNRIERGVAVIAGLIESAAHGDPV